MIKVKVLKPYKDLQKQLLFYADEEHEVSKERADELVKKGLVEIIKEPVKIEKKTESKE